MGKNPSVRHSFDQYCIVAYRPPSNRSPEWEAQPIILLLLKTVLGALQIYVHPRWRETVDPQDVEYLTELFEDLPERIVDQAAETFSQFCNLGVGPLVTEDIGNCEWRIENLQNLLPQFLRL